MSADVDLVFFEWPSTNLNWANNEEKKKIIANDVLTNYFDGNSIEKGELYYNLRKCDFNSNEKLLAMTTRNCVIHNFQKKNRFAVGLVSVNEWVSWVLLIYWTILLI